MAKTSFTPEVGERFGRLVVQGLLSHSAGGSRRRKAARCLCDCGREVVVLLQNLKERTRSCGCLKKRGTMSDKFRESRGRRPRLFTAHPGDRFGRLIVDSEEQETQEDGTKVWIAHCSCDCDKKTIATVHNLKAGNVQSCGCLQRDRVSESNRVRATHGMSDHLLYPRWLNMMSRCYDPSNDHYAYYGARGIEVAAEWHDVSIFIRYLEENLGLRPDGHSMDRIDNNGNYEPGNLRWADALTQRRNQRRYPND